MEIDFTDEEYQILLESAKLQGYVDVKDMIKNDYINQLNSLETLSIQNKNSLDNYTNLINVMFNEIIESQKDMLGTEDEEENDKLILDLLLFTSKYMLTDVRAVSKLFSEYLKLTAIKMN